MISTYLKKQRIEVLLVFAWLIIQTLLLTYIGVQTQLEATKYIRASNYLLEFGKLPAPKYFFYLTEILLISLVKLLNVGFIAVALTQIILNGIATIFFYKLCIRVIGNIQIAQLATFLLILFLPLQQWNVYLYTESLFISFSILFAYFIYKYPPYNAYYFLLNSLVLILLCITRPFGILYILPFVAYSIIISKNSFKYLLIVSSILFCIIAISLVNYAFKGGEDMDAMKPFIEGHVICFIPTGTTALKLSTSSNPLYEVCYYIVHNPKHFIDLMFKRIISFFSFTRPYYSLTHNVLLVLYITPVYLSFIYSLFKKEKSKTNSFDYYILMLISFYAISVTFQCDDYHSRFIMPIFPLIILFAAKGFSKFRNKHA